MVATIKRANENAATRERKIGIGSMDCKALYPSLTREWLVKIVTRMMAETKVQIEVVALTHSQEEIDRVGFKDLVYTWRYEAGPRPGITRTR